MMKKLSIFLLPVLLLLFAGPHICYANAPEPPAIIIIVRGAPDDLTINIGPDNTEFHRTDRVIASYYSVYLYDLKSTNYAVKVTTADGTYEIKLGDPPQKYNNVYHLDLENRTLVPGKSSFVSVTSIVLRIIVTLAIEALVFYLFGYRKKRSWLIFLIANLLTQGALNIWLNVTTTPLESYIIFSLITGELLVIAVELAGFLTFVKEHRRWRTALYVIVANLLSLFAGGYLITILPV